MTRSGTGRSLRAASRQAYAPSSSDRLPGMPSIQPATGPTLVRDNRTVLRAGLRALVVAGFAGAAWLLSANAAQAADAPATDRTTELSAVDLVPVSTTDEAQSDEPASTTLLWPPTDATTTAHQPVVGTVAAILDSATARGSTATTVVLSPTTVDGDDPVADSVPAAETALPAGAAGTVPVMSCDHAADPASSAGGIQDAAGELTGRRSLGPHDTPAGRTASNGAGQIDPFPSVRAQAGSLGDRKRPVLGPAGQPASLALPGPLSGTAKLATFSSTTAPSSRTAPGTLAFLGAGVSLVGSARHLVVDALGPDTRSRAGASTALASDLVVSSTPVLGWPVVSRLPILVGRGDRYTGDRNTRDGNTGGYGTGDWDAEDRDSVGEPDFGDLGQTSLGWPMSGGSPLGRADGPRVSVVTAKTVNEDRFVAAAMGSVDGVASPRRFAGRQESMREVRMPGLRGVLYGTYGTSDVPIQPAPAPTRGRAGSGSSTIGSSAPADGGSCDFVATSVIESAVEYRRLPSVANVEVRRLDSEAPTVSPD